MFKRRYLLFLFIISTVYLIGEVPYRVNFENVNDKDTLEVLRSSSHLIMISDHPPATTTALQRRVEADIPNLLLGLQSLGYYEPAVDFEIDADQSPALVKVYVNTGPIYKLTSFEVIPSNPDCSFDREFPLSLLGIKLGTRIRPQTILEAEKELIDLLIASGYPLAHVEKRDVIADQEAKTIAVILKVDSGPLANFGNTTITGTHFVDKSVIYKKIRWNYGRPYHPIHVYTTRQAIEESGLFGSVVVTPAEEVDENGLIPMLIDVSECKHRTIGVGLSYNTQLGPGFTIDWENRNIRSLGEKVSLRTEIWNIRQRGMAIYAQPDFMRPGQDLLWIAELERERTKGFTENFVSLSSILDRRINDHTKLSYGLTFKQLESEDTETDNGSFTLLKVPVNWRWSNADSLLDPTWGYTFNYRATPTFQVKAPKMFYLIQNLVMTCYVPFRADGSIVLAGKLHLGSISGETKKAIPAPERLYAGSENTLRGYRYLTVSPLNSQCDPVGGRSLMIYTLELRAWCTEKFGIVAFYDMGNVYPNVWPRFDYKQLQSVGGGLRYHTPVGPLRADFAIPLDRRKCCKPGSNGKPQNIDNRWEIYLSIGQAF